MEKWIDIPGFDGIYQISSMGNVRSNKWGYWLVLKKQDNGCGYLTVNLKYNNKEKRISVHRLVANSFINNPFNKKYVNHKNFNRKDNRMINLEWVTFQENMDHAAKHGKFNAGEKCHFSKLTNDIIIKIRKEYKPRIITQMELANKYNVNRATIGYIVTNKTWKSLLK